MKFTISYKPFEVYSSFSDNYICHAPYLRNSIVYDHDFWYTCVECISWSFFHVFKILIFGAVRRVKGQKMAQNDKKLSPSCLISQEPYIKWSSFMVHICKRIISPGFVYIFYQFKFWGSIAGQKGKKWSKTTKKYVCCTSYLRRYTSHDCHFWYKILILRVVRGLKGQKTAQNDKKFCLSQFISQEPCLIWLWFLVHMCKMMISRAFFFLILILWAFRRGKRAKNDPLLLISVFYTLYLKNCRSYHQGFWYTGVK